MHQRSRLILSMVLIIGMCIGSCWLIRAYGSYSAQQKIRALTTPLAPEVVQTLCLKFELPATDKRCRAGAVVYAPDFYADLGRLFEYGESTYAEVQAVFGVYQYKCESRERVAAQGYSVFRCWYDFHGDQMFPMVFEFALDDETLEGIMLHLFDSG